MTERNALCMCGSGKKYKKCCWETEEIKRESSYNDAREIELRKIINRKLNDARIKRCIYPIENNCRGSIIKAHSIQNRILKSISNNGIIKMIGFEVNSDISLMHDVGREKATTFTGFCQHHDKTIFQPIEDEPYKGTDKQKFLFAYRAFAFDYHKKHEHAKVLKNCAEEYGLSNSEETQIYLCGNDFALNSLAKTKCFFDQALINKEYGILDGIELTLTGCARIAVCSSYWIKYDLQGTPICDMKSDKVDRLRYVFISVFPQESTTHILLHWLKVDSAYYSNFQRQFQCLKLNQQVKVINNIIPLYSENFAMHPALWESFTAKEKGELESVFLKEYYDVSPSDLLENRSYNLFNELSSSE